MTKFRYWTSATLFTTTNAQMPVGSVVTAQVLAQRQPDDTAIRSIWWAEASYRSTGSNALIEGWWSAANVRLVINFDGAGGVTPVDIDANDFYTMGFADLQPRYVATQTSPHSVVQFESPPQGLNLEGRRKGFGAGIVPGVLASLYYYDQNGVWAGAAEAAGQRRARISGRVLWESDAPP